MNWEAIGAVGEVVGALGVIASLSYLAIQIRTTRLSDQRRALELQHLTYNDVRQSIFESEDLSRIFMDGLNDPDSLTDYERFRFMAISETMFMNAEAYWTLSQSQDVSDERLTILLEYLSFYLTTPGGKAFWAHPQSENLLPTFRTVIENQEYAGDRLDQLVRTYEQSNV